MKNIETSSIKSVLKIGLIIQVLALSLSACDEKTEIPVLSTTEKNIVVEDSIPENTGNSSNQESLVLGGDAAGKITIHRLRNKQITLKPGNYSHISVENVTNVSILGAHKVTVTNGAMHITNSDSLSVIGISFENSHQNAINIFDDANNLLLKDLVFRNISNTVITFRKNKKYNGESSSISENVQLTNLCAENIGTLFGSSGGLKEDGLYGLIRKFKFTKSTIKNSPNLANGIYLSLGENYEISDNIISNVNSENTNHNGIFHVIGNGKIFGNKITNHQGNAVRAWPLRTSDHATSIDIYNNIVYNSSRYSAFELQVPPWMSNIDYFRPANAKVYNNTAGKLNTGEPKFFEGRLLDLYNTFGTLEIFNNLSFSNKDEHLINNMSSTKISKNSNNFYFKSSKEAVIDVIDFKSRVEGVGAM